MSVIKMKLVSITGMLDSLDAVCEVCGSCGVFQPVDPREFYSDASHFTAIEEESPYAAPLMQLETAITRAGGKLSDEATPSVWQDEQLFDYVSGFSERVNEETAKISELATQLENENKDIEQFEHFRGLGIDLDDILHCETIKVRFGRLPRESLDKLQVYSDNPYALFFPAVSDADYYWGVYFSPKDMSGEIDRIFSSLYFERMHLPDANGTPEEIIADLIQRREETEFHPKTRREELAKVWQRESHTCLRVYARLTQADYFFKIRRYAVRYNNTYVLLTGWIPAKSEKDFRKQLDAVPDVDYTIEDAAMHAEHEPPVMLHNARTFRPFEFYVDMYGLPRHNELDPTAFVAITYTLLFGIMFGDLGQGLCVALVGWLMWKFKQMPVGRILIPCGLSAAVFGCVFGSVFGFEHALDPLYHTLFGLEEKPIEVMDSTMSINIILAAVVIGLVLIVLAMLLNIYSSLRRKDYESGLFGPNGVAGLVFFVSLVLGLGGQLAFGWHLMTTPYILGLIVLPVLLIFLREPFGKLASGRADWQPEKWGEYIVQNFFELFEMALTYMSNTMSFLRVGAFVLIHAGMMMAVFTLAGLFGPVGYVITVIFGNILVMVMEALLVAIQVLRLEFYEMFSRYYNGDGKPFTPLRQKTQK